MATNSATPPHRDSTHALGIIKSDENETNNHLEQVPTQVRTIGRFTLRGKTDDLPQNWWFASTAIPLLAATIGPLANVLSIAALVTKWRVKLPDDGKLPLGLDDAGTSIPDPIWEIAFNAVSLALGFFGNFFLLLNFTRRIRYIIALPITIVSWYLATGILIGIIVAMNKYVPPVRPGETYSQGFWHAVIAAVLYMIGSMILMVNMLGYFLGHYPQHFDLDDDQRTLILQTMMFFFWLAGGAAVFSSVCGMTYSNALYFCDVTVLTVGFGDVVATNDAGRGIVLPYAVFGIIFLGLMINSIRKFGSGISRDKVIRKHALNERERTVGRTVTSEKELRDRLGLPPKRQQEIDDPYAPERRRTLDMVGRFETRGRTLVFREQKSIRPPTADRSDGAVNIGKKKFSFSRDPNDQDKTPAMKKLVQLAKRKERLLILREEKDRFNAMRDIQEHTTRFKQYYALGMSVFAFGVLWCVGAFVFMVAERRIQNLSYFQCLYFCYVSLLTIGYGDYSPKSNAGKAFFVIWSLMAVPTMTILVSDMGDTVIGAVNRGTFTLADWTVMPKAGLWRKFLLMWPKFGMWVVRKGKENKAKKAVQRGFDVASPDDTEAAVIDADGDAEQGDEDEGEKEERRLKRLVTIEKISEHEMARQLARAIKRVAVDLRAEKQKKYDFEEWIEFRKLMHFSWKRRDSDGGGEDQDDGDKDSLGNLEWDWIGEDSPMLDRMSESEWVLERLCESLNRYTRQQALEAKSQHHTNPLHHFKLTAPTFPIQTHDHAPEKHGPSSLESTSVDPSLRRHSFSLATDGQHSHEVHKTQEGRISPVLSRGPSGIEIVNLGSRKHSRRVILGSNESQSSSLKRVEGDSDVGQEIGKTQKTTENAVHSGDEVEGDDDILKMAADSAGRRQRIENHGGKGT